MTRLIPLPRTLVPVPPPCPSLPAAVRAVPDRRRRRRPQRHSLSRSQFRRCHQRRRGHGQPVPYPLPPRVLLLVHPQVRNRHRVDRPRRRAPERHPRHCPRRVALRPVVDQPPRPSSCPAFPSRSPPKRGRVRGRVSRRSQRMRQARALPCSPPSGPQALEPVRSSLSRHIRRHRSRRPGPLGVLARPGCGCLGWTRGR